MNGSHHVTFEASDKWTIEAVDNAAFIRYRTVDLAVLWLPYDAEPAYITIAHEGHLTLAENPDFHTEWARADEKSIDLALHMQVVDEAMRRRQIRLDNPPEAWRTAVTEGRTFDGYVEWLELKMTGRRR
jgi:hypothetical protein